MRVVYDYGQPRASVRPRIAQTQASQAGAGGAGVQSAPGVPAGVPAGGERRETVMVIRVGAGRDGWRAGDAYGPDGSTRSGYRPGTEPAGPSAEALMRDREVRQHERAHQKALGPYASTPVMYDGMRAPDGSFVALGGQIGVDLAPVPGDPAATLRKARTVLNAALAPGDPSAADMRVAADAYRLAQDAQDDISAERQARQDPAADPTIEVFA